MLKIQEYISLFKDIEEANRHLSSNLNIRVSKGSIWTMDSMENLYLYNYHPKKSPKNNPITKEANGLILNKDNEIVSFPFKRFYDIDHPCADTMSDNGAYAQVMEDGYLVVIFYYKGYWNIQTEFAINATEPVYVNKIQSRMRYRVMDVLQKKFGIEEPYLPFKKYPSEDICYVFEYVSPYSKKITPYKEEDLLLITAYNKKLQLEMNESWLYNWKKKCVKEDIFKSPDSFFVRDREQIEDVLACFNSLTKGLVVTDNSGNRVKILNPRYKNLCKLLKAGKNPSTKLLSKMVLNGEVVRLGHYYKEYRLVFSIFGQHLQKIDSKIRRLWGSNKHLSQKEFARTIRHYKRSTRNMLFRLKRGKNKTVEGCIRGMNPKILANEIEQCCLDELVRELDKLEVEIEN